MRPTQTSYDSLWQTAWGDMQRFGPMHRHIREDLVRAVSTLDVQTILDAGCGSGENLAALAHLRRYELAGVDVSQEAIALARNRVPGAKLSVLDLEREALPERFDLVISIHVLEHIEDDLRALRNLSNMSRAFVYISTLSGRMRPSEKFIGHVRNYSPIELRTKLEDVGLHAVQMRGWGFPFYSPLYRSAVECTARGASTGPTGLPGSVIATFLYYIYRLNLPGRGDVLNVLASKR